MSDFEKQYEHDGVTIVWKPDLCIHSGNCFRNLPRVFNPRVRPWIQPEHAHAATLVDVVSKCPSGALSIRRPEPMEDPPPQEPDNQAQAPEAVNVTVTPGGPYRVKGVITVVLPDGSSIERTTTTSLCRCGASKSKPFCDGSHVTVVFDQ
ncbi:MAG: (4Fe-4S)-binding protein [Candidatus Kapabacteria bacterium]|jgi:uncharacterized Fe-S cluster protein YjdI|nr:(4Fe-4S)-binding protein [Candidatus Kapabacteria bacterium]